MKTICYGDSITWGWDPRMGAGTKIRSYVEELAFSMGGVWISEGLPGRKVPADDRARRFFVDCLRRNPDADRCIVLLGTNDLLESGGSEESICRIARNLGRMILEGKTRLPACAFWLAVPPEIRGKEREGRRLREEIRALGEREHCGWIDLMEEQVSLFFDGIHPDETGQRQIAGMIRREILKTHRDADPERGE